MRGVSITVDLQYDDEARVWFATSRDIRGLAVEGEDVDAVTRNVLTAIPALIELNGLPDTLRPRPIDLLRKVFTRGRARVRHRVDVAVDIRQRATLHDVPTSC